MAWVSWTHMYNKWLDAIERKNIDSFFTSSAENQREMRTTYVSLNRDVPAFTAYLKRMADQEKYGLNDGAIPMSIGGG